MEEYQVDVCGKKTGKVPYFQTRSLSLDRNDDAEEGGNKSRAVTCMGGGAFFAALGDGAGVVPMLESSQGSQNRTVSLTVSQDPWILQRLRL